MRQSSAPRWSARASPRPPPPRRNVSNASLHRGGGVQQLPGAPPPLGLLVHPLGRRRHRSLGEIELAADRAIGSLGGGRDEVGDAGARRGPAAVARGHGRRQTPVGLAVATPLRFRFNSVAEARACLAVFFFLADVGFTTPTVDSTKSFA